MDTCMFKSLYLQPNSMSSFLQYSISEGTAMNNLLIINMVWGTNKLMCRNKSRKMQENI